MRQKSGDAFGPTLSASRLLKISFENFRKNVLLLHYKFSTTGFAKRHVIVRYVRCANHIGIVPTHLFGSEDLKLVESSTQFLRDGICT